MKAFSSIPFAMVDLFWALFGLFELTTMSLEGKHVYTEYVGEYFGINLLLKYTVIGTGIRNFESASANVSLKKFDCAKRWR